MTTQRRLTSSRIREMADDIISRMPAMTSVCSTGQLFAEPGFSEFSSAVKRELHRPLNSLIASRSLCFLRPEPPLIYPEDEAEVSSFWDDRAGFAVQHVEQRNAVVHALCGALSRRQDRMVTGSVYVSRSGATSMSEHTDAWDAWIIQVSGRKTFFIRDLNGPARLELRAGHWLWLPMGWAHSVETPSDVSIHLSINLHRR